jgi:PAS domain S-box-containing protein
MDQNARVTEPLRMESETASRLALSEQRLELALSAGLGIGTWDWDVVSDRVFPDERFARLYGVDSDKARAGAPVAEFFVAMHPEDRAEVQAHIDEALRTGALFSREYRLLGFEGDVTWVVAEGRCEFDAQGQPIRFRGVSFDITERRLAEQRLRR